MPPADAATLRQFRQQMLNRLDEMARERDAQDERGNHERYLYLDGRCMELQWVLIHLDRLGVSTS